LGIRSNGIFNSEHVIGKLEGETGGRNIPELRKRFTTLEEKLTLEVRVKKRRGIPLRRATGELKTKEERRVMIYPS